MRSAVFILHAGLASAAASIIRSVKDPQPPPIYPIGTRNGSFAKAVGRLFEIDGRTGYFSGVNAWWLGHLERNNDVDTAIQQIVDSQYKIARVWGFGDVNIVPTPGTPAPQGIWFQLINSTGSYINYGEDGLQRLDYAISAAERLGLKFVLAFMNNWMDWGGQIIYDNVFHASGNINYTWYEDPGSQEVYRDYVRTLVTRYRNSTAIFAWQLGNEPRCALCDKSVITNWAAEVSSYIKSLDPKHMVTLGDEGWFAPGDGYTDDEPFSTAYGGDNGVDFVDNLKIPTLDYGVFHLYPNLWGYPNKWGNLWIEQHDDAGEKANKPIILEEYGSPDRHNHSFILRPWQEAVRKSGIAADQIWQFGPANLTADLFAIGDEYSLYFNDTDFEEVGKGHAKKMLDKVVE